MSEVIDLTVPGVLVTPKELLETLCKRAPDTFQVEFDSNSTESEAKALASLTIEGVQHEGESFTAPSLEEAEFCAGMDLLQTVAGRDVIDVWTAKSAPLSYQLDILAVSELSEPPLVKLTRLISNIKSGPALLALFPLEGRDSFQAQVFMNFSGLVSFSKVVSGEKFCADAAIAARDKAIDSLLSQLSLIVDE